MCFRRFILIFLLFFACDKLFAATFTVTNNGDGPGAGTLRQALIDAAANGTATTDYIYFNLPGTTQADITITVLSQLPYVSANVVIDGTTQPGAAIGVSNAKVIITPGTPTPNLNAFVIDPSVGPNDAIEFYGLYIVGFGPNNTDGSGIYTTNDCKLVVGAPGKGNVICGNYAAIQSSLQNAVIQSNFLGIGPDGLTPNTNEYVLASNQDYNNLMFGGALPADGNIVLSGNMAGLTLGAGTGAGGAKSVTVENNYFGTNYLATVAVNSSTQPFIQVNDQYTTLNVTNNIFSANETGIAAFGQATIIVKGNYFGTNTSKSISIGAGPQAIQELNGIQATIGGTTGPEQNVFTGYVNPIVASNSTTNVVQNEFFCNANVILDDPSRTNFVTITSLQANSVSGLAPPGATVQLYYFIMQCGNCNPNFCFATVTANAAGVWQYNGAITLNVMASSTVAGNTFGFQPFTMTPGEVTITNYDCHHAGSLQIAQARTGNFQFAWTNSQGTSVSSTQTASGLAPGTYSLQITETGATCPMEIGVYTIIDLTPKVFGSVFQTDCSSPTGHFTTFPSLGPGFTVANYYWEDANGNVMPGTNSASISDLPVGTYYLYITDSNGCNSNTAKFQVLASPATPVIHDNNGNPNIVNATCGSANGSITGITVTNATGANYGWERSDGRLFSSGQLDLTLAPAGDYYFYVDYDFNCPPVKSGPYTILSTNVITIDITPATTVSATCANSNGAITGVVVNGATGYKWYNSSNSLVGTSQDLSGVPAGQYYLFAYNATCTLTSDPITVGDIPAVNNFPANPPTITNASCGLANGGLAVEFSVDPDTSPDSYRWADATGKTIITDDDLTGAAAGNYQLYVTDDNGCESLYQTYTIGTTPILQIDAGPAQITPDQCLQGVGGIENITVSGGVAPYTYLWTNSTNPNVSTSLNINNAVAGTYTLQVKDATACGLATQTFTIPDQSEVLDEPQVDNLQVCTPGQAMLMVKNPQPGYSYRLYGSLNGNDLLDQSTTGVFPINVTQNTTYYITQYMGNCESARAAATVIIGLSGLNFPNTFTPNNDGINDYWNIKGIENYPTAVVQIFNRYGQKVFESRGYSQPFDGRMNGSPLPSGVYYYIINLNANCSLLSGSLTLIR